MQEWQKNKGIRAIFILTICVIFFLFDYVFNQRITDVVYPNLITEGILSFMTAMLFISLGRIYGRGFYRFLNIGFILLFISFLTDFLDQLFIHDTWHTTVFEKSILILAFLLIFIGTKKWLDDFSEITETLSKQATTDQLTEIFNRRGLIQKFQQIAQSKKNDQAVAILIGDIDYFKRVNDQFGHLVGDDVLKKTALELKKLLHETQFIGRWGGEEFAIIAPQTNPDEARKLAEKIRKHIEQTKYGISALNKKITISIGISHLQSKEEDIYDAIRRADQALYMAKKNGRNQCEYMPFSGNS